MTKKEINKSELSSMSAEQLQEHFGNWSKAIRGLDAAGFPRKEIAQKLGKRYQHVRNVLVTQLTTAK